MSVQEVKYTVSIWSYCNHQPLHFIPGTSLYLSKPSFRQGVRFLSLLGTYTVTYTQFVLPKKWLGTVYIPRSFTSSTWRITFDNPLRWSWRPQLREARYTNDLHWKSTRSDLESLNFRTLPMNYAQRPHYAQFAGLHLVGRGECLPPCYNFTHPRSSSTRTHTSQ